MEGADPEEAEEAEEEGQWEEMDRTTTKGHCTGRGDDAYSTSKVELRARTQAGFLYRPRWPLAWVLLWVGKLASRIRKRRRGR